MNFLLRIGVLLSFLFSASAFSVEVDDAFKEKYTTAILQHQLFAGAVNKLGKESLSESNLSSEDKQALNACAEQEFTDAKFQSFSMEKIHEHMQSSDTEQLNNELDIISNTEISGFLSIMQQVMVATSLKQEPSEELSQRLQELQSTMKSDEQKLQRFDEFGKSPKYRAIRGLLNLNSLEGKGGVFGDVLGDFMKKTILYCRSASQLEQ